MDKVLLRALYDGEDITAVFDHSYVEAESSVGQYTRDFAHRVVDKSLIHFTSDTLTDPFPNPIASSAASSSSSSVVSSSTMLAGLRQKMVHVEVAPAPAPPAPANSSSSSNSGTSNKYVKDTVMVKLVKLLKLPEHQNGITTAALLHYFSNLNDNHAPLFKAVLQRVAVLRDKKWYLRNSSSV